MEKPKRKIIRKALFKPFYEIRQAVSYDELVHNITSLKNSIVAVVNSNKDQPIYHESYEEAVARLQLTEAQLAQRQRTLRYLAWGYFVGALVLMGYLLYLLWHGHLLAALFDAILVTILSLLAYREHFWYMQICLRRLGCNFFDWLAFTFRGK